MTGLALSSFGAAFEVTSFRFLRADALGLPVPPGSSSLTEIQTWSGNGEQSRSKEVVFEEACSKLPNNEQLRLNRNVQDFLHAQGDFVLLTSNVH